MVATKVSGYGIWAIVAVVAAAIVYTIFFTGSDSLRIAVTSAVCAPSRQSCLTFLRSKSFLIVRRSYESPRHIASSVLPPIESAWPRS